MRYSILGFSQEEVLKCKATVDVNGKEKEISIDITDLLILQCTADFMNRQRIYRYMVNDKLYFSIQYKSLLEDLPILNIGKQALRDRIDKLVFFNLLEKEIVKNEQGSFVVFRIGENYEQLLYKNGEGVCSKLHRGVYQTTHGCVENYTPKDSSTINSLTINNKERSSKERKATRFSPPTIQEIQEYISENNYNVDAVRFFDFYETKGWMVGKNKMKDWRAAVRTWVHKENEYADNRQDIRSKRRGTEVNINSTEGYTDKL